MALGGRGGLTNDNLLRPLNLGATPLSSATPSVSPKPTPSPSPTPAATVAPTPVPTVAVAPTATTNSYPIVHMRASKSLYASVVMDINGGSVVQLLPDSDASWQQVKYNGLTGYIFKQYLTY